MFRCEFKSRKCEKNELVVEFGYVLCRLFLKVYLYVIYLVFEF